jgi:hypothetical protein
VKDVGHVQAAGRGDAGEGEHHHADQGAIAQPQNIIGFNGAQQLAGLLGRQDGSLALAELLARGFHGERGVVLDDAAGDQVVEQHAHGGHVLLEGGGRQAVGLRRFQVVAHIEGADILHALPAAIQTGESFGPHAPTGHLRSLRKIAAEHAKIGEVLARQRRSALTAKVMSGIGGTADTNLRRPSWVRRTAFDPWETCVSLAGMQSSFDVGRYFAHGCAPVADHGSGDQPPLS